MDKKLNSEKLEDKKKEFIENINNLGFEQLNNVKFSEEIDKKSDILEKLDIEDNYLSNIAKMKSQENDILDQLNKNKFERNNTTTEIGNLVGNLNLTEEKLQINWRIGASEDIEEIGK